MAKQSTYYEKLRDPRWQKKRLEILERAEWSCELCGSETETLHIHHGYYRRNTEPWDYPNDTLHCLCEGCHFDLQCETEEVHERIALLRPELVFDLTRLINQFERMWPNYQLTEREGTPSDVSHD